MTSILASGTTQILLATGAGAFAIAFGGAVIVWAMDREDRRKVLSALRHPVRTVFTEDEPDEDDDLLG
jgi:hypothetical protein